MNRRKLLTSLLAYPAVTLAQPLDFTNDRKFIICKLTYSKACSAAFFYGSEKQIREFIHQSVRNSRTLGGHNFSFVILKHEDRSLLDPVVDSVLNNEVKFCNRNFPYLNKPEFHINGGIAGGNYTNGIIDKIMNFSLKAV